MLFSYKKTCVYVSFQELKRPYNHYTYNEMSSLNMFAVD